MKVKLKELELQTMLDLNDVLEVIYRIRFISKSKAEKRTLHKDFLEYITQALNSLKKAMSICQENSKIEVMKTKFYLLDICFEKCILLGPSV